MIAFIVGTMFKNRFTSGLSAVAILGVLLFGWHTLDKTSAVRSAVVGYVAKAELSAAQAELQEIKRQQAAADAAAKQFARRIVEVEADMAAREQEIVDYETQNPNRGGVVGRNIFGRLRGN
ncbi:hypothetical protein HKX54_02430 [Sulfitobacter sp. M57]|uniref:hypothetical protein n=1 Tax=unclassified Sulfitobacter TaxID=196795 RepID=UPI0023E15DBE|nr:MULTISPECIES: hypothetical protein [unclassified Sulfitobacter]MDF3413300.1 hypothetical protein [Sulfitobacter sp. KE5]MDF3421420.1 hypothetical protein [Sulfitobacter sp. KE43]MDF3431847.1 hypothetical protein [Sulfitobacter sp. KE42]MDF3457487.1 hypothetical protein [Sulfitobacter sp. S74]MDF3461389.1 hypothetical protein [Sulfitobacter sp. Ks18]